MQVSWVTPSSPLARGVCECVHAEPRGHRPGAVQRHLPTTAGAGVADPLPRGSGDRGHVDAVGAAHGALPGVHSRAAGGTSCAAVHASLAQRADSPNLVRVPGTYSWELPSPSPSEHHGHSPESSSSFSKNHHSNSFSALLSGLLPVLKPFPAALPNPTCTPGAWPPALETSILGSSSIYDYSWTETHVTGLCSVPRSVLLLLLLFFVPGVVMAVAYGLISRELYLGLRFDGDSDCESQSQVGSQGGLPGGAGQGA